MSDLCFPMPLPKPRSILVVEDESMIGLAVSDLLSDEGFRVIGPVATCKQALLVLDSDRPDAVLLDLMLRDGSCIDLARELKTRHVPFVVFSGHTQKTIDVPELKGAPWVEKPGRARDIIKAVSTALSGERVGGGGCSSSSALSPC